MNCLASSSIVKDVFLSLSLGTLIICGGAVPALSLIKGEHVLLPSCTVPYLSCWEQALPCPRENLEYGHHWASCGFIYVTTEKM